MKNWKMIFVLLGVYLAMVVAGAVMNYAYITSTPFYYFVGGIHLLASGFVAWKAYKEITKEG